MAKQTTQQTETAPAEAPVTVVFYDDRKGEPAPHATVPAIEPETPAEVIDNG